MNLFLLHHPLKISLLCLLTVIAVTSVYGDVSRPTVGSDQPTVVRGAVAILDVDEISDTHQNFTINLYGDFRWRDPRLVHSGPGKIRQSLAEIWNPRITLLSMQQAWSTYSDFVDIAPDGEVSYRFRLWGNFSQPLDLRDFPFDQQRFEIPIVAADYSSDEVILAAYEEDKSSLTETYSVADWRLYNGQTESREMKVANVVHQGLVFGFEGERKLNHFVIKVIIPLVLIVVMSWIVFWLDPKDGGIQLGMASTAVLTMIAYHIAFANNLPDIPYVTRMDLFLFGATLLVFASLIEVVVTFYLARTDRLEQAHMIDVIARWVFPILFALVTVYSFFVGYQ